jgi:DmsE family decaheme c-type cytochrome
MRFAVFAVSLMCGGAVVPAMAANLPKQAPPQQAASPQEAPPKPTPSFDLEEEDEGQDVPSFELEEEDEDAPEAPMPPNARHTFTGWQKCVRCHEKQSRAYVEGPHARTWDARTPGADIGCERCHGPGLAHDLDPGAPGLIVSIKNSPAREVTQLCLSCHDRQRHASWQGSMHDARNVTCVNCHSVHHPKSEEAHLKAASEVETCAQCHRDKAAKMQRAAHMPVREGKMACSACHNPHGSTNVRLLRAGSTVSESCVSCHTEKRGPFLWEHAPIRESCTSCHDSHGASNDRMLQAKVPMLCQRCHIHTRHPATPYDAVALLAGNNRLVGRACSTCHPAIHGSNHPSGQFFMR